MKDNENLASFLSSRNSSVTPMLCLAMVTERLCVMCMLKIYRTLCNIYIYI